MKEGQEEEKIWGKPEKNWFPISRGTIRVLQRENPSILKFYVTLCDLANALSTRGKNNGIFWRTDVQLVEDTNLSPPTIVEARKWLITNGYLACEIGKPYKATRYRILE